MASLMKRAWADEVAAAIQAVPDENLERAAERIGEADIIITAGNGGSASLADHMAQTVGKPNYKAGGGKAAVCLTSQVSLLTAHTNDGGWHDALSEAARPFFETFDSCLLVCFSSSGRSENIVRLARLATDFGHSVIGFTGFDGGPLRDLSRVSIHVASHDYEVVEPAHDALMHRVQYHLRALRGSAS